MEQYQLIKELGRGAFGVTFLAINRSTGQKVAVKAIDIQKSTERGGDLRLIQDEIETLKYLASDHKAGSKYLAKYYDTFKGHLDDIETIFIVSEYIDGQDLYGFLNTFPRGIPSNILWPIFTQLLLGLKYIHDNGYAHRDLKPENILITKNNEIKYIDFGLACLQKCRQEACENTCTTQSGTVLYTPPEFYKGDYRITLDTEKAHDIWSLGVVMYELTFGKEKYPFEITNGTSQLGQNIAQAPIFRYQYRGDDGRTLIYLKQMLINNINRRPTVGQCLYLLLDQILAKIW